MNFIFLLGSGISKGAGMPMVDEISDQVFDGDGVVRHTDGTYYLAKAGDANYDLFRGKAEPAIAFTKRLREEANRYFAGFTGDRKANYEDVANFAKQIADALLPEYENPALLPLLEKLQSDVPDTIKLLELATNTHEYIRDIVWRILDRPIEKVDQLKVDHLKAIIDGCRELGSADLFELNHDRVLETALAKADLDVSDGFTHVDGDVVFWTDEFDRPIRHFKLHGSITWFLRTVPEEPWRGQVPARSMTNDPYHARDATGKLLDFPADFHPAMLIGTFDKALVYDRMVYADQHYRFQDSLRQTDELVVIGYGFCDKAINNRFIGWLHGKRNRRLVVVHGNVRKLVDHARSAISRQWDGWIRDGRLRVVEKWVADVTWSDIVKALNEIR